MLYINNCESHLTDISATNNEECKLCLYVGMSAKSVIKNSLPTAGVDSYTLSPTRLDNNTSSLPHDFPPTPFQTLSQRKIKNLLHSTSGFGRTLGIFGTNFLRDCRSLIWSNWCLALCAEHPSCLFVATQVGLGTNKDEWCAFTKVCNFRKPLALWYVKNRRGNGVALALTLSCTFPRLVGKSTENTIRMTSLSG